MPKPYCKRISYEPTQKFGVTYFPVKTETTFGVKRPDLFRSKEHDMKPSPASY
jgi:hypothetical protein